MTLSLVKNIVEIEHKNELEDLRNDFWDKFFVAEKVGNVKDLSIPGIKTLNKILNDLTENGNSLLIEHNYVSYPERGGVPIFELSSLQKKYYSISKVKLLRYSKDGDAVHLIVDGSRNGPAPEFAVAKGRKHNEVRFKNLREAERDNYQPERYLGKISCHRIFTLWGCDIQITKKYIRIVSGSRSYERFPEEIIIHINTKKSLTLVGAEETRYAGTYTYIPTEQVKQIQKFQKKFPKFKSQIRVNRKRNGLGW